MGNCFSTNNTITPNKLSDGQGEKLVSSSRNTTKARLSKSSISISDFMGIKKSDSIDNFYKIDKVIGRGKFHMVYRTIHV